MGPRPIAVEARVLGGLPVHDDNNVVSWLHCPDSDGDDDTSFLSQCHGSTAPATVWVPAAASHAAANKLAPPSVVDRGGVVKFTFFSRPQAASAASTT